MSKQDGFRRVSRLPKQPIPEGRYLVHNSVIPEATLGLSGFRAFTLDSRKGLVRCHCNFGGVKNAELHKHYRVQFGDNALERRADKAAHAAALEAMKNPKPSKKKLIWERHDEMRKRASLASAKAYRAVIVEGRCNNG